jgi:aspartyl-tRNA(Asn)/glutamyl-tRNA(Gln) amidotransferase subunit A
MITSETIRPILRAGVAGLAALYQAGTVTPVQVTDLYYRRISRYNAALGAYNDVRKADALREAEASTQRWAAQRPLSPIDGVPIGVKANIMVAGSPWHAGIGAYADRIADRDAACIALLKAKGVIVLGMLNMHEGALGGTTDNPWFGRTHNPYRRDFIPGGSSGGSGAAVTTGLCAAALGTDTIGSVRLPAAFCGCVGYKPSQTMISLDGVVPLARSLDHVGVLARSVADCALVAAGAATDSLESRSSPRRIAIPGNLGQMDVDETLNSLLTDLADRMTAEGAEITCLDPKTFDIDRMRRAAQLVVGSEAMREFRRIETDPEGFSQAFIDALTPQIDQPEDKIAAAYATLASVAASIREQLSDFSALMMPIAHTPAFPFSAQTRSNLGDFAAPANIACIPSIAVPLGLSDLGLPLSVQFMGIDDAAVLGIAAWAAELITPLPPPAGFNL